MSIVITENGEEIMEQSPLNKSYGSLQHTWKTPSYEINLYAKKRGKAGGENTYEFPPPMDKSLFFGKCLLTSSVDLTLEMWHSFYENVMKFEDIEDTEEEEEESIEGEVTKEGYLKDGFVVSDNELEEEPYKIDLNKTTV